MPSLTVHPVAGVRKDCLAHDDGQVSGLVWQDCEADHEQNEVRRGEHLHGLEHGHVLNLVDEQGDGHEEERDDQTHQRQREGIRHEDKHQDAGNDAATDVDE